MTNSTAAGAAIAPIYDLDLSYAASDRCPIGDGLELYYEIHGDGAPLTFMNHLFIVAPVWRNLTERIRSRTRTVFYDLRNQGASTRTEGPIQWSDHVEDLRKLLDHLEIERTYLVGTSISALAARDFAVAHPERVAGLVLVGPAFSPYGHRRRWAMTDSWLATLRAGGVEGLWNQLYSLVLSDYTVEQGGKAMYLALREAFLAIHSQDQIDVNLSAANSTGDEPEKLRRISCPTLLMVGDSDWLWSESSREEALRLMPQTRLQVIPRAGHLPYFEASEAFEAGVIQFLTECEAA